MYIKANTICVHFPAFVVANFDVSEARVKVPMRGKFTGKRQYSKNAEVIKCVSYFLHSIHNFSSNTQLHVVSLIFKYHSNLFIFIINLPYF